ncbi:hypothetical protein DPX16_0725 [Anabarilius grahami]|uniref:Ig-like domain-containing protein n=1 Tax=Anabarilius grahami TaxID=495550 RepID=A0A3N0YUI0_ANAGA|nr:hypothetical protein DPX16_0725 [Anabarilius grahami]
MDFREFILIFGLMLLKIGACLEQICWDFEKGPCYAALGYPLYLQINDLFGSNWTFSKIDNTQNEPVCRTNSGMTGNECDHVLNRVEYYSRNFLLINRVIRADSGNYNLSLSYRAPDVVRGRGLTIGLQINVEAPIGSVEVSISCSSSGEMRASCSSDGDPLLYSWTLNGDSLMDAISSIVLDEGTDGNITCSVKNHVSQGQKTISVKHCPVSSVSVVFVLIWCFQLMVLLGLLGGFHIYMRHVR